MELRLKPHSKNKYPLRGILIKSSSIRTWILEIQKLFGSVESLEVYPIPDTSANSIWGCFLFFPANQDTKSSGKHERCQMLAPHIFIPEYTILYPKITATEIQQLFSDKLHVLHPEFAWVELPEAVDFKDLLVLGTEKAQELTIAEDSVFIPNEIKSFQIKPLDPEKVLRDLEEKTFPKRERLEDKPLDLFEKGKLTFYEMLFKKEEDEQENSEKKTEKTDFMKGIESFFNSDVDSDKDNSWSDRLQDDYEDLDRRNQKHIERLMDMLKNNPEEALKYAIPLDHEGSGRGGSFGGGLDWNLRWGDFSLFGNMVQGSGGGIDLGDDFYRLENQYRKTAAELIEKGEYKKAAFVYMKLLKDYRHAAKTLEEGKYYEEAATIYLKHLNDKGEAARCYEMGNMIHKAIELYKELKNDEKVGDLYTEIHETEKAKQYYQKVVDQYCSNFRYIKASKICREKMADPDAGQELLLRGWRTEKDAVNCLSQYFSAIAEPKELEKAIQEIYTEEIGPENRLPFLEVLKKEHNKKPAFIELIKEMAYEIVAAEIPKDPGVVSNLRAFNSKDKELLKDTMRFRLKK